MNEHQLKQKQQQDASRRFLQALSAGQANAQDRFGRAIQPGQKLLYHPPYDLIFEVQGVSPVLDPRVPPGLVDVLLTVTFPVRTQVNMHNPMAIIVGEVDQQAQPETPGDPDAPAGDPDAEPEPIPEPPPGLRLIVEP